MSHFDLDIHANRKEVSSFDFSVGYSKYRLYKYNDGYYRLFSIQYDVKKNKNKVTKIEHLGIEIGSFDIKSIEKYLDKIYMGKQTKQIKEILYGS